MNYLRRVIILLVGVTLIAFGASLLITANLGSDAVTVLNQGVGIFLNIDIGMATLLNNAILFIFLILFNRKKINVGTIASVFLTGPLITFFMYLMPEAVSDQFIVNLLISVGSLVLCSFGLSLYIYADVGLGSFEGFVDLIARKTKLKFGYTKIGVDIIFFTIGAFLGGVFHIASILSVIIIGPLINLFLFIFTKINLNGLRTTKELE